MSQYTGVTDCGGGFIFKPTATPPPINWQGADRYFLVFIQIGLSKPTGHLFLIFNFECFLKAPSPFQTGIDFCIS